MRMQKRLAYRGYWDTARDGAHCTLEGAAIVPRDASPTGRRRRAAVRSGLSDRNGPEEEDRVRTRSRAPGKSAHAPWQCAPARRSNSHLRLDEKTQSGIPRAVVLTIQPSANIPRNGCAGRPVCPLPPQDPEPRSRRKSPDRGVDQWRGSREVSNFVCPAGQSHRAAASE